MARRRFRYDKETGEMVEVFSDQPATNFDYILWGDHSYKDLKATDGTDISTRTKHREYMRNNNLCTIDDFAETNRQREAKRMEYRTTGKGGAVTREDVARVIQQLENRK